MKTTEIADSTLTVIKKVSETLFRHAKGISSLNILHAMDIDGCAHLFVLCNGRHVPQSIWEEQLKWSPASDYKVISAENESYTALLMTLQRQKNEPIHSSTIIWDELADIQAHMENPPTLEHVSIDMCPETVLP